ERPVFVESESRKVGNLRVPDALIARMRASGCIRLEADEAARVALLLEDYAHFVERPRELADKLDCLRNLHGAERIAHWKEQLAPNVSERPMKIGKYSVLSELGQGASAVVYLGEDPFNDRKVAVKVAKRDIEMGEEEAKRFEKLFLNEASLAGKLNHPNIVAV